MQSRNYKDQDIWAAIDRDKPYIVQIQVAKLTLCWQDYSQFSTWELAREAVVLAKTNNPSRTYRIMLYQALTNNN